MAMNENSICASSRNNESAACDDLDDYAFVLDYIALNI